MLFVLLATLALAGVIYLMPTVIAIYRDHPNRWLVGAINVMTGLTVLGWFFALREALKPLPQPVTALAVGRAMPPPQMAQPANAKLVQPVISRQTHRRIEMGFFASIASGFSKYASFSGRASRSEFWYFELFVFIALGLSIMGGVPGIAVAILALFLPQFAVQVRRLHDTDHAGPWVFVQIVPFFAIFPLLIWYCRKGTDGDNRFGSDPLMEGASVQVSYAGSIPTMGDKTEQLARIKGLLDNGTITQVEFDRMKSDVLAS